MSASVQRRPFPVVRAVVFDFDGLILDTETPEFLAWQAVFREMRCELTVEEWAVCIGTTNLLDPHTMLEKRSGRTLDRDETRAKMLSLRAPLLECEQLRPGVAHVLDQARAFGVRVGLASSSSRRWVQGHLDAQGITSRFHVIKTAEDVERVKPDPALYLRAVEALGVPASETIALEDSLNGLRAAKSAGLFCIAVPNSMTRHLPLDEADMLLDSLEQCSLRPGHAEN